MRAIIFVINCLLLFNRSSELKLRRIAFITFRVDSRLYLNRELFFYFLICYPCRKILVQNSNKDSKTTPADVPLVSSLLIGPFKYALSQCARRLF